MADARLMRGDYRLVSENDELRRRVDALEKSMTYLQNQNMEMYKVLKSKNSFLDFSFDKSEEEDRQERARKRERTIGLMASMRAFG